ncbi:heavy metal translocating P-type ATPase [Thermotoga sp. SG1]|uniref:heavy metal translocating P-type ATPase n=1 Tax=Thermotoga sp. SG1 TaxID=126739 RepID=UPI001E2B4F50|nr:heavy metal translocating P-type ATPase [Thermotoga sp. SG1]
MKPGEKIPLDGKVVDGHSVIDTSVLTGESIPCEVRQGDTVLSGSINMHGVITLQVTKDFSHSTVSKIIELVENASSRKARVERFITKFSRYYSPFVVFSALAIAVFPPLVIPGAKMTTWVYRALVFLVISCPCALVLSVPLTFFSAIGKAARQGILVKGGNYLDALNTVKVIALDKTGTLTKGVFKVIKMVSKNGFEEKEVLETAAYAEFFSNHPVAKAILEKYNGAIDSSKIEDFHESPGFGVTARIESKEVLVGNYKLMKKSGVEIEKVEDTGIITFVAINRKLAGYIVVSDEIKEDARETIETLKKRNIKVVMLTGDREEVARKVADELGIEEFFSELLPHEKLEKIESLLKKNGWKTRVCW